jgi:arsenate reductase (thioredoxin)
MDKKPKILFLSTGNSTRSQIAEGFVRDMAGDRLEVVSAGIEPGDLNASAVEVMREVGIDISNQKPKNVTDSLKDHFAYVVTVCDMARERAPIFPFTPNLLHWSIQNPANAKDTTQDSKQLFRQVRDEIQEKVRNFLGEIAEKLPVTRSAVG